MIATRSAYLAKTSAKTSRSDRSSQYPFARYRAANSGGNRTTPSNIHLLAALVAFKLFQSFKTFKTSETEQLHILLLEPPKTI